MGGNSPGATDPEGAAGAVALGVGGGGRGGSYSGGGPSGIFGELHPSPAPSRTSTNQPRAVTGRTLHHALFSPDKIEHRALSEAYNDEDALSSCGFLFLGPAGGL